MPEAQPALDRITSEQTQLQRAVSRFRPEIEAELRRVLTEADSDPALRGFYGQMAYHLGWVDAELQPISASSGKLLRPALVLWSCALAAQAAGADDSTRRARHQQALPAAAAVELVHNFSLIHDDIEDRDRLRHGRPAVWTVWGDAQAINTGDGMFALARLALWESVALGFPATHAVQLGKLLDRTCLRLCEGQFRDMAAEASNDVTPRDYLDMIARKTAALMRASTAIGGTIGAPEHPEIADALADFGEALGLAFQMRDDLLGIWAANTELGKSHAGDLRRKKMTLPVIYALTHASATDRKRLRAIYRMKREPNDDEISFMLALLDATSRAWCREQLAAQCHAARAALDRVAGGRSNHKGTAIQNDDNGENPAEALGALIEYIAIAARG